MNSPKEATARRLREYLADGTVLMPGCWDALSAKLAQNAGFGAVCITGGGVSQTHIGRADLGYITQTEMLGAAASIVDAVSIPVIADIDDGFGNLLNVQRTMELAERIGLAGAHIEDVAAPKRCPELGGSTLVPLGDMVRKIEAAIVTRRNPDFVLIARTDNYEGIASMITRAKAYEQAGADMIMPIGVETKNDLKRLADSVSVPLWYGQIGGGSSPIICYEEASDYSIGVLAYTLEGFTSAYAAHNEYLLRLAKAQTYPNENMVLGSSFDLIKQFESVCGVEKDELFQKEFFNQ